MIKLLYSIQRKIADARYLGQDYLQMAKKAKTSQYKEAFLDYARFYFIKASAILYTEWVKQQNLGHVDIDDMELYELEDLFGECQ